MKDRDIARVYADSIIELSKENSVDLTKEISKFVEVLNSSQELESVLFLEAFSEEEKTDVFNSISEKIQLNGLVKNLILFLIKENRMNLINMIYKEVVYKDDLEKGFMRGTIKGASENIDPATKEKITKYLKEKLSKEPILTYEKSEKVTAGYRVQVEDFLIDASLDNQLENFKKTIMI